MVFCINNKVNQDEKIKSKLEPETQQGIFKRILFEWRNISILLFLYTLQGVPGGLAGSIRLLLQTRGTNYSDQAIFSLVSWPFNLKLLWAPLVDAIYWKRMGRRKSWLVPVQYRIEYLRIVPKSDVGVVTLSGFMFTWSIIYFVCTTLIFICKKEEDADPEIESAEVDEDKRNLAFAASVLNDFKLVEAGLSKEVLAQLSVPLAPLGLLITVLMTKWTSGLRPMSLFRNTYGLTYADKQAEFAHNDINFDPPFVGCSRQICFTCTGVAQVAFITKISDPAYGATYATLFNTGINVGAIGSEAVSLWLVDPLTVKSCSSDGLCSTVFDGYYVETIACVIMGAGWFYFWGNKAITELQEKPESAWKLGTLRNEWQAV
ncbi:acetyl-coenzyme A transporter 1-like [Folsomia candida]|uniref:acetyl-coenzyme A transporter 1-like n=1 Tax=Folsomia candida TaxID=158441 RepID=UPI00160557E1|nr:acetyl-coenzyme A transporter 1-like [Folsomia candida]